MNPRVPQPPANPRRRPQQARSRQTAQALREAFVQVLVERGWAAVTVREITLVAGTALGSFYDYFASKEDLARVTLHLRTKALLTALRHAAAGAHGQPLPALADAVTRAMAAAHAAQPQQWAAHYLLERHFSSRAAYLAMYRRFTDAWADAIAASSDWPAGRPAQDAARAAQAILYGLFTHAHLSAGPGGPDLAQLQQLASATLAAALTAAAQHAGPGLPQR